MARKWIFFIFIALFLLPLCIEAEASNPNLFVSAENSQFANHFTGSMVIEVVVNDPLISDTDQGKGEPDVTINGKKLRMVQATDGQWYAYFANVGLAKIADQIVANNGAGAAGESLDFGVFCSSSTNPSVLGVGFSNTVGVAVPSSGGLAGFSNGISSFNQCTGSPISSPKLNNVVREPKTINTNVPQSGQIGLNQNAWPIIQLYSFDDVEIKYNRAGGSQKVNLTYDKMANISLGLDRTAYPLNSEVFVTIADFQLNQDPTDEDSWTFNIDSPVTTFYQAFTETGDDAANGGTGLINLIPQLSSLGFDKNGKILLNSGTVTKLKTNSIQPSSSVSDGTNTFSQILTFVESQPNTGIFENFDKSNISNLGTRQDAPRGQSATIQYNSKSTSIVSGTSTASINLELQNTQLQPGQETPVTLQDSDQNLNPGGRDKLDVFRSSAIIPALRQGNPITLEKSFNVKFYTLSTDPLNGGTLVPTSVPDLNSARLIIDTTLTANQDFEKISLNLGTASDILKLLFIDSSQQNNFGTNWINYDLRSFQKQLDLSSFSDTSMKLHFGSLPGMQTVTILNAGDISSAQGLLKINESIISAINNIANGNSVFLEINFDTSNDSTNVGKISNEQNTQPIVIDFFSFGQKNNQKINNAIYRFELEETSNNSGMFKGTVEYAITNQLNQADENLIKSLRTIDDNIKFLSNDKQTDANAISISYSDIDKTGVQIDTSYKTDILPHSGKITTSSKDYRFGQPVIFILTDPDLNLKDNIVDIYTVVNDPNSPNVDAVGDKNGNILLEILIKGFRYQRCNIDGKEYGGLGSTGFTLMETGVNTGIFEGSFKMPSQICDKSRTKLITTAGGSLDAKYYDSFDSSGEPNIFSLSRPTTSFQTNNPPALNSDKFILPKNQQTVDVVISGSVSDYSTGTPVLMSLIGPDKSKKDFQVYATKNGFYSAILTLQKNSIPGIYTVNVIYNKSPVGSVSFEVLDSKVPQWIKNNAKWWSSEQISDSDFIGGIEYLIQEKIIAIPPMTPLDNSVQTIPKWVKNNANWWSEGTITEDEFLAAIEFLVKNSIIRV